MFIPLWLLIVLAMAIFGWPIMQLLLWVFAMMVTPKSHR